MKKKILSVVMACMMAVSCCSGVMAMAAYNAEEPEVIDAVKNSIQMEPETEYREPEQMILTSDPGSGIVPFTSETPVVNESISEDGITWYQKQGYTAYRIWVQNDTNREMKVTVTYTGMPAGKSLVFRVQAGKSNSMVVNNAWAGVQHYADFQTDDGSFEGICSVRISDTPFN